MLVFTKQLESIPHLRSFFLAPSREQWLEDENGCISEKQSCSWRGHFRKSSLYIRVFPKETRTFPRTLHSLSFRLLGTTAASLT
jgi:hypothetical protein